MNDSADSSIPLSSDPPSDLPPLRLTHLLLFVAVCGVYLVLVFLPDASEQLRSLRQAANPVYRRAMLLLELPAALFTAAAITVALLLAVWKVQGKPAWRQPGHWIAVWVVWQTIGNYCCHQVVMLLKFLTDSYSTEDFIEFWRWAKGIYALEHLPIALAFLCLATGLRGVANTWLWRFYFALTAVWLLIRADQHVPFNGHALQWVMPGDIQRFLIAWAVPISLVLLLLAMANDLRPSQPRRHWSHWLSASYPLVIAATGFLQRTLSEMIWKASGWS